MFKYILQSADGIQWFAVAALLIFFGAFCVALFKTFASRKEEMDRIARIPLDD